MTARRAVLGSIFVLAGLSQIGVWLAVLFKVLDDRANAVDFVLLPLAFLTAIAMLVFGIWQLLPRNDRMPDKR